MRPDLLSDPAVSHNTLGSKTISVSELLTTEFLLHTVRWEVFCFDFDEVWYVAPRKRRIVRISLNLMLTVVKFKTIRLPIIIFFVSAGGHESAKVSSVVKFSLYQSFESCKTGEV